MLSNAGKLGNQVPDTAALRIRVDAVLADFLDSQERRVVDIGADDMVAALRAIRALIGAGGKRIRPILCYLGWYGAGEPDCDEIVMVSAALEFFHVFCLIQDDVIDRGSLRRGCATIHHQWRDLHTRLRGCGDPEHFGNAAAILIGDLCWIWSDTMFHASGMTPALLVDGAKVFDTMRTETVFGGYLEMMAQARGSCSPATAATIIRHKTAKYTVEGPLKLGGVLAGADATLLDSYTRFGASLGEAFQLRDDILGTFGTPELTGKSNVDDLTEGKPTMLIALARHQATSAQATRINELYGRPTLDEREIAELRALIADTGALAVVEQAIATKTQQAIEAVIAAPLAPSVRDELTAMAGTLMARNR